MTTEQLKQQHKATALNAIRKLYHPLYKHGYTYYDGEGSFREQRDSEIGEIITKLERELEKLKSKNKSK